MSGAVGRFIKQTHSERMDGVAEAAANIAQRCWTGRAPALRSEWVCLKSNEKAQDTQEKRRKQMEELQRKPLRGERINAAKRH